MRYTADNLLALLPAVYGIRDAEQGGPLRELLEVFADQIAVLEENLEQLYDDQFIETCAEWVVPYIGSLIGYTGLHGDVPGISSPRSEVANTVAYRRRKGTVGALEQVAQDVTGCKARVVEYFQLLGSTQYMNHIRPRALQCPDMRRWEPLERTGSAFDTVTHTVDVRSIETGDGKFNIPNVGVWLWRLGAYSLTDIPPAKVDDRRYLFNPLGCNVQLFNRPLRETDIAQLAGPLNVPEPISRRALDSSVAAYCGEGRSFAIRQAGALISSVRVVAANLSDGPGGSWAHKPNNEIAVDPVLGRIAFPENEPPPADLLVSFHAGFGANLGGGEYERSRSFAVNTAVPIEVSAQGGLQSALDDASSGGVVEITNNLRYDLTTAITVDEERHLELRAANEHRPVLILSGDLDISGALGSQVSLNGLVIGGGAIRVPASAGNQLRTLRLRHCTLVPGRTLEIDGSPRFPDEPGLIVEATGVTVEIDHCIVSGLRVAEGSTVVVSNSIVDSSSETGVAYAGIDGKTAGGMLQVLDSTVIGKVWTVLLEYASNTIFLAGLSEADTWPDALRSERSQSGCVRFCYAPLDAAIPRRYHCQPDLEIQRRIEAAERPAATPLANSEKALIEADVVSWLEPRLTSARFGDPGYGQLHLRCPRQIAEGADDEAEMGVFHELHQPQRDTNLRLRLDEYLRFGLQAGVCYAT